MSTEVPAHRGPLIVDISNPELECEDKALLSHPAVGGVILFARNTPDVEQTKALCESIKAIDSQLLIVIDQEGGRVQRLLNGVTRLPPLAVLGSLYAEDPQLALAKAYDLGWLMASEIHSAGIDLSLAPVLDLDDSRCPAISNRSFSPSPQIATELAHSYIKGMNSTGMGATGKHFPGHGQVTLDSHVAKPLDPRSLSDIEHTDLIPFLSLIEQQALAAVMPAHITFTSIDKYPVGFSRHWLQTLLRDKYGFSGLIFSDDLNMDGADIPGGYRARAQAALDAGCDLLLLCNNRSAVNDVIDGIPHRLASDEAHSRKLQLLQSETYVPSDQDKLRRSEISSWLSSFEF